MIFGYILIVIIWNNYNIFFSRRHLEQKLSVMESDIEIRICKWRKVEGIGMYPSYW